MGGHHHMSWQKPLFDSLYQFGRGVPGKPCCRPFVLKFRYLVATGNLIPVPTATGVCQIEHIAKVGIKIRFTDKTQFLIIIRLPKILVIVLAVIFIAISIPVGKLSEE